ncbi:efflux protein EncT [Kwoniella heveanensis CBS 569]|uniref:Efflux protein EncT n=1 Tax=Kwoniella heveanensis BCC8398 TaxID=1296120 RepID=A0A1B9GNX2_9TREE|nr:efflux protein EncT [Kwoniella heveanensis BCC8398]OCF39116.1 efflux protein EncT [Kwoniella heveanensis CBS 569]
MSRGQLEQPAFERNNTVESNMSSASSPGLSPSPNRTYVDLTSLAAKAENGDKIISSSAKPSPTFDREMTLSGEEPTEKSLNDIENVNGDGDGNGDARSLGRQRSRVVDAGAEERGDVENVDDGAEIKLSQKRKWFLLAIFSLAQYLDIASYAGIFVFTDAILVDLDILFEASSWVITAYSVTFAAFLLFWGRFSDLYSAKPVFAYGFLLLGVLNLIISFMTNKYAYFIFRAISGIAGAATIPSAFRLILAIFEPSELNVALTLFGLSGAFANVTGLVLAGFFGFITAGGQQASWRWFFRMIAIICVPFAFAALALVPKTRGDKATECSPRDKFKRLDLVGSFLMLIAIILLILGLTLGASYGWKKAGFLVPFLLSWPLFVAFFVWEARLPEGYALIPSSFWKIPNMTLMIVFALGIYPWWAVNQLPFVERSLTIYGETPIIAAVRMLPQGIAALAVAVVIPPLLQRLGHAKWPIAAGSVLGAVAFLLMIFNRGKIGTEYWRWLFPAYVVGSGAYMAAFLGTNITVMTSVPPAMSGVAGAMLQVSLQVGAVLGLSVQAGLLTIKPGSLSNYANVQASFWFQFGWTALNALIIIVFFRPGKAAPGSAAAAKLEGKEAPAAVMAH